MFYDDETGFTVVMATDEESRAELRVVGTFPPIPFDEPVEVTGE